jgi:hypothetical protein
MAAATQFDVLAERDRFIVLYPDVDGVDASSYRHCWKGIWAPALEGRGVGDAGGIASARYSDPRGPNAAAAAWAFLTRWGLSGPLGRCGRAG